MGGKYAKNSALATLVLAYGYICYRSLFQLAALAFMPYTRAYLMQHLVSQVLLLILLLAGSAAKAQHRAPAMWLFNDSDLTTYTGPRYRGGPDSLRASVQRVLRQASPTLVGQLFVRLELDQAGQIRKLELLPPPDRTTVLLSRNKEVKAIIQQLQSKLANWLPVPSGSPEATARATSIILPLPFGTGPVPLVYSDENPAFPAALPGSPTRDTSVLDFLQRQFRYPVEDLRNQVQGKVYLYFEVSETGAVEQRRIAGSLSRTIDAEVMRVLQLLPNALTPPRYQGQAVRVAYVMPITLSIR
jgi:protein TonB